MSRLWLTNTHRKVGQYSVWAEFAKLIQVIQLIQMVQVRLVQNCKTCFFQVTYKNLTTWYTELRQYRPAIPTLLAANKIDENMEVRRRWHFFIDLQDFHHRWQLRASLLPARTISLSTMCLQQTGLMLLRCSGPGNSCKNALFKVS